MAVNTALCLYWISLLWIIGCKGQESRCPTKNDPDRCCSGYRKIDGNCTACIGFTGENCENACPSTNYGLFCRDTCNCTNDEYCDTYVGCLPNIRLKNTSSCKQVHNDSDPVPDFSFNRESCNLLLYLVIALGGSHLMTVIVCVAILCLKCCRVPPQRTKTSSDNTNISELHAGTEINHNTSRFRGISRENENVNGDPYHTLKNQGLLEISTSYDTFATADRFNKHGDQNWNATNRCDVPAFPSDNLHVVRNTTAVNSHATQSSGRPYSLQKL